MTLCTLTLLAGCSIDFDHFLRGPGVDAGTPRDTGAAPTDLGVTPPRDAGVVTVTDTGVVTPPSDTGVVAPTDTGIVAPRLCHAPYLLAVAENLDANTARLLRWSFADDLRCDDLMINIAHPRAIGVTFDTASDLGGPQLIVVNDSAVSVVDATSGAVIRDLSVPGQPRSVFDIVSNGVGTFAVAYSFMGDSPPGSVGNVRVFDHRDNNLREVQAWNRNVQFGLSVRSMTAFPGNQGQYLQLRPADSTGSGYSASIMFPSSSGFHTATTPPIIANRNGAQTISAYRTVDRRGHYALPQSGSGTVPVVYIAGSSPSSASLTDVFQPTVRCAEACPGITRAVAYPDEEFSAAAICEISGTQYTVVRFGGASMGCHLLDTDALGGRWRINDLAVMPR